MRIVDCLSSRVQKYFVFCTCPRVTAPGPVASNDDQTKASGRIIGLLSCAILQVLVEEKKWGGSRRCCVVVGSWQPGSLVIQGDRQQTGKICSARQHSGPRDTRSRKVVRMHYQPRVT